MFPNNYAFYVTYSVYYVQGKKFKVKIKRNRANNFLICTCNKLKYHAFYILLIKKTQQHVNRKFLLKKEDYDNFRRKKLLKINKNQIRIMFVIKTINIRNRKFIFFFWKFASNHDNAMKGYGNRLLLGTLASYYKLIIFISPKFPGDNLFSL